MFLDIDYYKEQPRYAGEEIRRKILQGHSSVISMGDSPP